MKISNILLGTLILISMVAHSEESMLDKTKSGAIELWEKTKITTSEVVGAVSEKTSELGKKTAEIGSETSKDAKEASVIVWDEMKKAGTATADGARNGASKIREMLGEDCQEDNALCHKDKE
jgi:hypothetical protein